MKHSGSWFVLRVLGGFADGAWVPLRQKGMVVSMRPDWDTAPASLRALGWYAGVLIACLALRFSSDMPHLDLESTWQNLVNTADSFLRFSVRMVMFACVFSAIGRWFVPWNCTARSASPLQFLGMSYTVAGVDQLMALAIEAAVGDSDNLGPLLAAKDMAAIALALMVLVDFFRPRPPRKPRRRPADIRVSSFDALTRPAKI